MKKKWLFFLAVCQFCFISLSIAQNKQTATPNQAAAVRSLIKRLLPGKADQFAVSLMPKQNGKDCFELESRNGKIVLRGTNGVAIASALHYYMQHYAHCDISWNGSNLNMPALLPAVPKAIRRESPYTYRYYLNYCTFNYTMSWWNWDRWEKEIDFMALNGINMPLALTGQNMIWYRVYKNMGFTDKELESFFSGPAYFNWFWMGNLDGWGGPLPMSWMKSHAALQKKILARERELGMTPILPAFTGHVPPAFKDKFPQAKLKKTKWSGFPEVYILDPDDSLFSAIGRRFLQEEIGEYGTDHLYSADTFNENTPPTNDSLYLNGMSKKVYQSMADVDARAKWIMQGWLFHFSAKFWQPTQIKALLNAVPDDRMIILDLWSENHPVWNRTDAYYGKPWLWCMLHNFGGNISMYGRMDEVAEGPAQALHDAHSGKLSGIGLTPEAIEQNPVMYALMLENVWRNEPVNIKEWLPLYARNRYGKENKTIEHAWTILKQTVYTGGITNGGPESIITGRPTFDKSTVGTRTQKNYNPAALLPAWDDFVSASNDLKNSEGFQYDMVDVTRQIMANYADTLQRLFAAAYKQKDTAGFNRYSDQFLQVIDDMDMLLGTRKDFLLGRWLKDARDQGTNDNESNLYEQNARDLITLWGDKHSGLHEYSNRQWAGMLKSFYKPRWQKFFAAVQQSFANGSSLDITAITEQLKDWEWNWVNGHESYAAEPTGDAVAVSVEMYKRYRQLIVEAYHQ